MIQLWKKYRGYLFFGALVLCFVVTRIWRISTIPSGVHADEAGMAYDAWSLAFYGVDRWLKSWPVYLTNMGTGQSSLYAFICAGLFRLFDYSVLMMRLPAVIFSFLTFLFGMRIAQRQYPTSLALPLAVGGLITVCPYFILASRLAMDCNLMLGMSSVFLYCLMCAVSEDKISRYVFAGIAGGITLYSYALSYVVLPIFLIGAFFYVVWVKKFNLKGWIAMAIPLGLLALPLILVQCVNAFDWPEMKLGIFTITKLEGYRITELRPFSWGKFATALHSVFLGDDLDYNTVPGYLNLYGITILFFAIGLLGYIKQCVKSIRQRQWNMSVLVLLWFLIMLFLGGHVLSNVNRLNAIFLAYVLIAVEGIRILCAFCKNVVWQRALAGGIVVAYLLLFLNFGNYYYRGSYTRDHYPLSYFDITVSGAVQFLEEHPEFRNQATYVAGSEIFMALSILESPYELRLYEEDGNLLDYWYCGGLGAPEEGCNYIVWNIYSEYMDELRGLGYQEVKYPDYSLFYWAQ